MTSSEIELVTEAQNNLGHDEQLKNNVYAVATYGDVEALKRLVLEEGCSVSKPDGNGYYALQWAALNNHAAAVHFILEVRYHIFYLVICCLIYCIQLIWQVNGSNYFT